MGIDKRPTDLTGEILDANLSSLKASLVFVVDDPEYKGDDQDVPKLKVATFLQSTEVPETSPKDYLALTPAGLKATVASTTKTGIVKKATDDEIEEKTATTVLTAANVDKIVETAHATILHITTADIATYVGAYSNINVTAMDLYFFKVGTRFCVSGYFSGSISSTTPQITLYLNVPDAMPTMAYQGISISTIITSIMRPLGGSMTRMSSTQLAIRGGIGFGSNLPSGTNQTYFLNALYI